jgi:two-component system, sensor histidine kinase and response regulator
MAGPVVRRILVVEDQAIHRDLVTLVLRKLHYEVDAVGTAAAAGARLAAGPYALVLLDRSLPDMDGLELARRLRTTDGPERSVPIVLLGLGDEEMGGGGPRLPAVAQGQLAKPVQIDRLLGMVRSLTSGRAPAAGPADAAPPPVDIEHLLSFTDGDVQLERELVALFLSTAAVYLERMDRAIESGQDWAQAAHALKGASANLGARRVATMAAAAEAAGPDRRRVAELAAAVEEVRGFFRRRDAGNAFEASPGAAGGA